LANTASAKKRIRQNVKRQERNKALRSRYRGSLNIARTQIESGDVEAAAEAVKAAVSELDRAVSKGVLHQRNASRKKSRLMKKMVALQKAK